MAPPYIASSGVSRIGAIALRDTVLDDGSFRSWDTTPLAVDGSAEYRRELAAAAAKTGLDESVLTGEGAVFGRRVAFVACEFDFLAGSIGVAAAERITAAVERATAEGLPLVASPSSGGTRMQEGTVAFLQMVKIAAAVELHKRAHLPYLVYLRHPTTGGVFASWGSLGHVTAAEPGALIGFLGPRVYEHLYGEPFPAGRPDRREPGAPRRHRRRGPARGVTLDARPHAEGRRRPARCSAAVARRGAGARRTRVGVGGGVSPAGPPRRGISVAARHIRTGAAVGDGPRRGRHHAAGAGQVRWPTGGGARTAAGDRRPWFNPGSLRSCPPLGPAALRVARRGMALAAGLKLPLVLVIDTAGPALTVEAEQDGLAGEIARCLADLVTLDTPTVSVLLGQGSGGPALAMVPADRVLAALHGWLAPLPPEGASAIVFRDVDHAPELAAAQGIRSADLLRSGIVDAIVPERPDAADEPLAFTQRLSATIATELHTLSGVPDAERLSARLARYRRIGLT